MTYKVYGALLLSCTQLLLLLTYFFIPQILLTCWKHRNYIPHNATRLPTVPLMFYVSSGWHSLEELSSTEKIHTNRIFSFQTCSHQTVASSSKITQGNVSDAVQLPLVLQNAISQMQRYALRPVVRLCFVIGVRLKMCE